MRNTKFKQAFAYRFRDSLAGAGVFFGIMLLILAAISVITAVEDAQMQGLSILSLSGFCFSAGIVVFIFGIVTVREDMRVMNQHGVGRRSTFLAGLLTALAIAAIMTAFGALLLLLAAVIEGGMSAIQLSALLEDPALQTGTGASIVAAVILGPVLLLLLAHLGGEFLSLLFYRLPKVWKVIVGIALPLLVLNGLPIFFFVVDGRAFDAFMHLVFSSVWSALGFLALLCALAALINWLLMRRAPIRAAK